MPSTVWCEKAVRAGGADIGLPPEIVRTAPSRMALVASVATMGMMFTRATSTPFSAPMASARSRVAGAATSMEPVMKPIFASSSPAIDIVPAIDMSSPRCWITMVWPTATMARMAAKGSIEAIAAGRTVPGATTALTAKSAAVPSQIHANSFPARRRILDMGRSFVRARV